MLPFRPLVLLVEHIIIHRILNWLILASLSTILTSESGISDPSDVFGRDVAEVLLAANRASGRSRSEGLCATGLVGSTLALAVVGVPNECSSVLRLFLFPLELSRCGSDVGCVGVSTLSDQSSGGGASEGPAVGSGIGNGEALSSGGFRGLFLGFRCGLTYRSPRAAASASRRAISLFVGLPGFFLVASVESNEVDLGASACGPIGEALLKGGLGCSVGYCVGVVTPSDSRYDLLAGSADAETVGTG